MRVIIRDG